MAMVEVEAEAEATATENTEILSEAQNDDAGDVEGYEGGGISMVVCALGASNRVRLVCG